jgi:hypothetical protein
LYNNYIIVTSDVKRMCKKSLVFVVLIILLFSGCIDAGNNGNNPDNSSLDSLVMMDHMPEGYEYLGSVEMSNYNEFSENIVGSKMGAYRDHENFDVLLNVIQLDSESSALEFISNYKAQYEQLPAGDRFTGNTFNGHEATTIKTYRLKDGVQTPKYQIIWNNNNIVFIVISNSHLESSSLELAKATGY